MMTTRQGVGFTPLDLLRLTPGYYIGQQVGQAISGGGGSTQPQPLPVPSTPGDMVQGGATGGTTGGGLDKTTMILIGAGVVATGIIIYAVATAKRRR